MRINSKRIAKILLLFYFIVVCIPATLYIIIRVPFIQNYIVHKVSDYLSKELKTEVSIKEIDITFFLNISLSGVQINDQRGNALISADRLSAGFKSVSLSNNKLSFSKIQLLNPNINIRQYDGEEHDNIWFLLNYFSSDKKTESSSSGWSIKINRFSLENGNFSYQTKNSAQISQQIDFNNLSLKNINIKAHDVFIGDSVHTVIEQLSFYEQSGFQVLQMSSDFTFTGQKLVADSLRLETTNSSLLANLKFQFSGIEDFNDFINSVDISADFKTSVISSTDIARFTSELNNTHLKTVINGKVRGKINSLTADSLLISTGMFTELYLNGKINGLPDFENSSFDIASINCVSGISDISSITRALNIETPYLKELSGLTAFNISGKFKGNFHDFYTETVVESTLGNINANLQVSTVDNGNLTYSGSLKTENLNIGQITENKLLGIVTSELHLNGENLQPDKIKIEAEGKINEFTFNNYIYKNISLNAKIKEGVFDGHVSVNDSNIYLGFNGKVNFIDSIPEFHFQTAIQNAQLNKLHFNRNNEYSAFSGNISCHAKGKSADSFTGNIEFNKIKYREGINKYEIAKAEIKQNKLPDNKKVLTIESSVADGKITGIYNLDSIDIALTSFLNEYILSGKTDSLPSYNPCNITYSFTLKKPQILTDLFIPELFISENTKIDGNFNSENNILFLTTNASVVDYSGIKLDANSIKIETFVKKIYLTLQSAKLEYSDSIFIENISLSGVLSNNKIDFSLNWDNNKTPNNTSGDLKGSISFEDSSLVNLCIDPSVFTVLDNKWDIAQGGKIGLWKDKIGVNNLIFTKETQIVSLNGISSISDNDALVINFQNFDLLNIQPVLKEYNMEVTGILEGNVHLKNILVNPYFTTDLHANGFTLQKEKLGNLSILSTYDNVSKSINSDINIKFQGAEGTIEPIRITGKYYTTRKENNIDYIVKMNNYNLKTLEPFVKDFMKIMDGRIAGTINVKGSIDKPLVNGKIQFMRTYLKVHYLNTYFSFADEISITENKIYADNLSLLDQKGNSSSVNLLVQHNNFKDFKFNIKLKTQNDFIFMNTTARDNELFYGTVIANGLVTITGNPQDITMSVNAKTSRGTIFSIPMNESGYVSENNFITFTNSSKTQIKDSTLTSSPDNELKFKMNLDLQVTPDAEVQIIFDPKIGDIMRGRGEGNLKIGFDLSGEFVMFGNLNILSGDYLFTLENVINKKFYILPGGAIQWQGDPYEAKIDLTTYYPITTSLYNLVSHLDPSEIYKRKVPVQLQLSLKNNLMSPDISFDISLPQSDENTKNLVKNALISDQELNRQVFALLILNTFVPPDQVAFNTLSSQGIGTTTTELLSNQLSNWLSQISKDFDIGVKYRPGTEMTTDEVELIFSKQFFNDRMRVEGNVGFGGQQMNGQVQNQNQVVGDVNIEYKITSDGRISAKAFNKSNPVDIITQNSPYTQGIGIFYRKDFNKFTDLKKRKKSVNKTSEKKQNENQQLTN